MKARMALQQPCAAVPAKNRIVVARGANLFGFREAAHRFLEERCEGVRRAPHVHLCLGSPFMQETRVIEAFIALDESVEKCFYFSTAIRGVSTELVGDGEAQQGGRPLG